MHRVAIVVCLTAVSCSQPRPDHTNEVQVPHEAAPPDAPRPAGTPQAAAPQAPSPVKLDGIFLQNELKYEDLGKDYRWVSAKAFARSGAQRDAQGWPPADRGKITVRYTNPDRWGGDTGSSTGWSNRDCLVAICPASKQIIESDLEAHGTHAILELPSADCQIRLTSRDMHGFPVAFLHREPGIPGTAAYDAPKLPAGTAVGAVVDLGEVTPRRKQ